MDMAVSWSTPVVSSGSKVVRRVTAMGYQGSLSCQTGEHGFAFASIWGENW